MDGAVARVEALGPTSKEQGNEASYSGATRDSRNLVAYTLAQGQSLGSKERPTVRSLQLQYITDGCALKSLCHAVCFLSAAAASEVRECDCRSFRPFGQSRPPTRRPAAGLAWLAEPA